MRVLGLTLFGKNIFGYAPFEMLRAWVRSTVEERDDVFVDFVIPDFAPKEVQEALSHQRVVVHRVPMLKSGLNSWAAVPMELYNLFCQDKTDIFYDAVLSHWVGAHPLLKKAMKRKFEWYGNVNVPIFGFTGAVLYDVEADPARAQKYGYYGEDEVIADTTGYLCDFMCFLTNTEKRLALSNCRKYLSSAMALRVDRNSLVATIGGIECDKLDVVYAKRKKGKKARCTLGFGGRFDAQKSFRELLDVYTAIYRTGRDVDVACTTAEDIGSELDELKKSYPHISFKDKVRKEEFFEVMGDWDVGISLSTVEAFGLAYQEMMYAGVLLVMLDCPIAREVTPPDYPFRAKGIKEVKEMLMYLVDRPEVRKEWIRRVRSFLRERFEYRSEHRKVYEWMVSNTDTWLQRQCPARGELFELVKKALKGVKEPFSFDAVCARMQKLSATGHKFGKRDRIGRFKLRLLIMKAGYRDLCDDAHPRFVKRRKGDRNV